MFRLLFFFFKQKTAYEITASDWSSDVCSSDLMAAAEMRRLAAEAERRWPIRKVAMAHRIGLVPIGQASVAIAVSAGHRAEAFAACRWLIDRLKEIVPIWKREHFRGGQVWIGPQQGIPETSAGRTASRGTSARGGRRHAPRRGDR